MRKGHAASASPPVTAMENRAFPTHSSTCGFPTLPLLLFFFLVKDPPIHKFMATVEIHGAMTFIPVTVSLILAVSSISQFHPPQQVLGSSVRWDGRMAATGPCSVDAVGPLEGAEGLVSSVLQQWQALCSTS